MKKSQHVDLESTEHKDVRTNNPEVGLIGRIPEEDQESVQYEIDPNLSPAINWAGKAENTSFEVPLVSLHVHDRIEPQAIVEGFRRDVEPEVSLFHDFDLPPEKAIEFYQHSNNWSNRLIAGDSLLVMNSLLHKENLAESVKMIYIDPPYGIRYKSNFQPFMNRKPGKGDIDENLTREPNQIQAFRDTWQLGVHSYLAYLRDRLLLSYELLHPHGSCFVQIGDENVDLVAGICAEIFGRENRVATITVVKTSSSSSNTLPEVADYLIWYAKDKTQMTFNQLYEKLNRQEIVKLFDWHVAVELSSGECRPITPEERFDPDKYLPEGSRIFQQRSFTSTGESQTGRSEPYTWNGVVYPCPRGSQWSVSFDGMDNLARQDRLVSVGDRKGLYRKRYEEEVPGRKIHNVWWRQMNAQNKKYVVETSPKLAERCLLMSTNPGDLILDPTCGSGTTAFVAETWGRRWITCDTSRIAINLARQRLATSSFKSYELRDEKIGIGAGYECSTFKTPDTKNLAYNEPIPETELIDQPVEKQGFVRVSGPFTVEAVPAPIVESLSLDRQVTHGGGGGGGHLCLSH